jgi:microcystin-dependent protein
MDSFIGTIQMFGFNFAPNGWALCNGQLISIQQNTALFSLIGTYYGGNGQTTFGLPNLQSRLPTGMGQGAGLSIRSIGQTGGLEQVNILTSNLPPQAIPTTGLTVTTTVNLANVPSNALTAPTPTNSYIGASISGGPPSAAIFSDQQGPSPVPLKGASSSIGGTLTSPGGNVPLAVMNPFLAVNFSIALQGVFPSRN